MNFKTGSRVAKGKLQILCDFGETAAEEDIAYSMSGSIWT